MKCPGCKSRFKPVVNNQKWCSGTCYRKHRLTQLVKRSRVKKKEIGQCRDCPSPAAPGKLKCSSCSKNDTVRTQAYREKCKNESKCMTCASVVIDKRYGRLCRTHWYADKGRGRVESADEWSAFLIGLYEGQSRLCRTCGIFLVEGVNGNMSLDRITPKARGGEYTKSNVRWLCSTCNSMKNNMLDQELLNQCRRIVQCLG